MAVYPDKTILEFHNGTIWNNISRYVVSDVEGYDGFASGMPDDRVGSLGNITFSLNNVDGLFSPMGGDAARGLATLTGWNKNAKLRLRVLYTTYDETIWIGKISSIESDSGVWGNRRVHVTGHTWMEEASRFSVSAASILTNQKINQAVTATLARMNVQPESTDFSTGTQTLPTVFDSIKTKSKVIAEFYKLALSELGYIYLKKNGALRVESRADRLGSRVVDITALARGWESLERSVKNDQINYAKVRSYPRVVSTTLGQIFSTGDRAIKLIPGVPYRFRASYSHPSAGTPINATGQVFPVPNTDYFAYQFENGTGTQLTYSIGVNVDFYSDVADVELLNLHTAECWLTRFVIRGYPIYIDNPHELSFYDSASVIADGEKSIEIDQKYKGDSYFGALYANTIVELNKVARTKVKGATFLANKSHNHMVSFLTCDVGTLLELFDNKTSLSNYYYVYSRSFKISKAGKIINFGVKVIEAPSVASGALSLVTSLAGKQINFGYVPHLDVVNLPQRSWSFWSYLGTVTGSPIQQQDGLQALGYQIAFGGTNMMQLYQRWTSGLGVWNTPNNSVSTNVWIHVVVTQDTTNPANDPIIYINKVSQVLTEASTPAGTVQPETGIPLLVGGNKTRDLRVYNRILPQADVDILGNAGYNGGAGLVTNGLIFQAPTVRTEEYATRNDLGTNEGDVFFDNIYGLVGYGWQYYRNWYLRTTPNKQYFRNVWSPIQNKFAAVGDSNSIMTSPDGNTWTDNAVTGTCYGIGWSEGGTGGMYIAVGPNQIKTSPDGTTWTNRTAPNANDWRGVAFSSWMNITVAVATSGAGNRVMTSINGTTWTAGVTPAPDKNWHDVDWSPKATVRLFAACAAANSGQDIMTSPDGINWTLRNCTAGNYYGITWSTFLELWVAVGDGGKIITSPDGLNWTLRTPAVAQNLKDVVSCNEIGLLIAVGDAGSGNRCQISTNGITWTAVSTPANSAWYGLAWSPLRMKAVAVQYNVSNTNRAMIYY